MPLTEPNTVNPAKRINPRFLFFYGKEKTFKTTIAAQLPYSYLCVLQHEGAGADYIEYKGHTFGSLDEFEKALPTLRGWYKEGKFKYLVIDTADALVSWLENRATDRYGKTVNKEKVGLVATVLEIGYGKGTDMLAQMLKDLWAELLTCCDGLVMIGHCKSFEKTEQVTEAKDIDLPGKLRNLVAYRACATAYCFLREENGVKKAWFTFEPSDKVNGGARIPRLAGKRLCVGEMKEGKLVADWSGIYLPEPAPAASAPK